MKKIIIAAAFFTAATVIAGPLGFSKGMTFEEIKKQGTFTAGSKPFIYTAKTIASGHPEFELYNVLVTPEQGLCKIWAVGKDIETSSFGTELESKYKTLVNALSEKYGAPAKNFDFLRTGSVWKESQYWMMGLLKKERILSVFWAKPENSALPDSIETISVEALALSGSKGFITIAYDFDNVGQCLAVVKSKQNSNL